MPGMSPICTHVLNRGPAGVRSPAHWPPAAAVSAMRVRVIPGLHNSGGKPSMESLNLLAPSQVRYLVGRRPTYLIQPCLLGKMKKDRAAQ